MSKYTTEVRFICENAAGLKESVGYNQISSVIQQAIPNVFNFDFPIFDDTYRNVLCTKILKHFYTREIAFETVGLWKLKLDTKLNEIMPYYNQLYKSELIKFNPMHNTDLTRDHSVTANSTQDGKANTDSSGLDTTDDKRTSHNMQSTKDDVNTTDNGSNKHTDAYSDTPQGGIIGVEELTYLSSYRGTSDVDSKTVITAGTGSVENNLDESIGGTRNTENSANSTTHSSIANTEDYVEHVMGKDGGISMSAMLQEFRSTFRNIDMEVIEELNDLFFQLW